MTTEENSLEQKVQTFAMEIEVRGYGECYTFDPLEEVVNGWLKHSPKQIIARSSSTTSRVHVVGEHSSAWVTLTIVIFYINIK